LLCICDTAAVHQRHCCCASATLLRCIGDTAAVHQRHCQVLRTLTGLAALLTGLYASQSIFQIYNQVVGIFESDRNSDIAKGNAHIFKLVWT
jgi:hypothetical protein